jgi:hypothetical protein
MSWHFLQDQEEASWEGNCLDGAPSALLKLLPTSAEHCSQGSVTDCLSDSQYGTTYKLLTGGRGADLLTLSAEDSRARILAVLDQVQESSGPGADSGARWRESSVRFDLKTYSWKTRLCLWDQGLHWSSVILPQWGIMLDGECSERTLSDSRTNVNGYGFTLSTVCATEGKDSSRPLVLAKCDRGGRVARNICGRFWKDLPTGPDTVSLNPSFAEWMMGWPIGWTDLKPLVTDKYQSWLQQHGKF